MSVSDDYAAFAASIEHTNLRPDATAAAIAALCAEAKRYGFHSVCVQPSRVAEARAVLDGRVPITTVIGFPLGATTTAAKVCETEQALADGADECDMVIAIGAVKDARYDVVEQDIAAVVSAARHAPVKTILECCYLTDDEIAQACACAERAGAAYIKTSTGFGTGGATVEAVRQIKKIVGTRLGIKAAGGIRTYAAARAFLDAGATRIGTSSGVAIINALRSAPDRE